MRFLSVLFVSLSLGCDAPPPQEVLGSRIAATISRSESFKRGPSNPQVSYLQEGWLWLTPKFAPVSAECEKDFIARGLIRHKSGGWMTPTDLLPSADFRQFSENVYGVRCAHTRFLDVVNVDRSGKFAVAEFRWSYVPSEACEDIGVESVRRLLVRTYTSHAFIDEKAEPDRVFLIDF